MPEGLLAVLKTTRSRIIAILAAIAVVLTGVIVPVAASAAVLYPAQAPGSISTGQYDTSKLDWDDSGFPAGTTFGAKQWYRGSTAIPGATGDIYEMKDADHNQLIKVRVTFTVPGFAPTMRFSPAGNFTFTRAGILSIGGVGQVGTDLVADDTMSFTDPSGGAVAPNREYQWFVGTTLVRSSLNSPSFPFPIEPSYFGKTITLKVRVTNFGIAPQTYSANVPLTVNQRTPMDNSGNATVIVTKTVNGSNPFVLTAEVSGAVAEPGNSGPNWQWYRANYATGAVTAITGKTTNTYTPTAADYPYRIFARATFTKPNYQPLTLDSDKRDYSIRVENRRVLGTLYVGGNAQAVYDFSYEPTIPSYPGHRIYVAVGGDVTYAWKRSGVTISGATGENLTITSADLSKTLSYTISAKKDGWLPSGVLTSAASPKVLAGAISGFSSTAFTVNPTTMKVTAAPVGSTTPVSTITKYQWRRNGVIVFTGAAYQLTAADYGKTITVLMTHSAPGYANAVVTSHDFKPWVQVSSPLPVVFSGPATVGTTLTIDGRTFTNADTGGPVGTSGATYQWFRNGAPVSAGETYALTSDDRGKTITVRMTVSSSGLLPSISTSVPTPVIGDQPLTDWEDVDTIPIEFGGTVKAPTLVAGSAGITGPAGFVTSYQWFRGGVAVPGATKATYALTAADRLKPVHVRVTTTHAPIAGVMYGGSIKTSVPRDYTIRTTSTGISGLRSVGYSIYLDYTIATGFGPIVSNYSVTYQWLRNGVAIPNTDDQGYTLTSADLGKTITARATFAPADPSYLPLTVSVVAGVVTGTPFTNLVTPFVEPNGIGTLKATVPAGITPTPTSYTYQWLRNGVAIPKQTLATYTLVAADANQLLTVRVTPVRAGYTSTPLPPVAAWDPDITPLGSLGLASGPHKIGETIGVSVPGYETSGGLASPFVAYRWLRNGVVIAGQTGNMYTLGNADLNASIQGQAIITLEGHLARTDTSAGTFPTAKGHTTTEPTAQVTFNDAAQTLTASISGMEPATPAPALAYQWLRNGSAISKATLATYKPGAADLLADLSVRITVNRGATFDNTIPQKFSDPKNYRIIRSSGPVISGTMQIGQAISIDGASSTNQLGAPLSTSEKAIWYRNGAVIAGQTATTYVLQPADVGRTITARVITSASGYLTATSALSAGVSGFAPGVITGSFDDPIITMPTAGTLKAALAPGSITTTGPLTLTYQWYRNSAPIPNAKAQTYKLVAADTQTRVSVRISVARSGYTTLLDAVEGDGNVLSAGAAVPVITANGPLVPDTVIEVTSVPLFTAPGVTNASQYTLEYNWRVDDATTTGWSTSSTYTLTAADAGKTITVTIRPNKTFYYWGSTAHSNEIVVPSL